MITVHIIFNAHLDPVWLWPWTSGLDAALATCRSACDRLDAHPDLTFTQGEAWVYEQVERTDPALFARIKRHVERGQWEITGGWWVQPDCNLPGAAGFAWQIALGKRYFMDHFGQFPRIACNVDSFGHAATLPSFLRAAGQDAYIFMRPQEHEMTLPARFFRWRTPADGAEVVAFRIAHRYQTSTGITLEHVRAALDDLPDGVEHTMCFVGVGDHGGGPTERQIAWCRENAEAVPGCRLVFSTPSRFFAAISEQIGALPVHAGELQHHAVGCYSVLRRVKTAVRRAEQRLEQAEVALRLDPWPEPDAELRQTAAWRRVCFHQFHDTLGGTCLPSTYEIVEAQLGEALATADELVQYALRRRLAELPDDPQQRVVFWNPSDAASEGYVSFEPWLIATTWRPEWRLLDENGDALPWQLMHAEVPSREKRTVLTRLRAAPGELRVLRIDKQEAAEGIAALPGRVSASDQAIAGDTGVELSFVAAEVADALRFPDGTRVARPRLELLADTSDTWSHDVDRYTGDVVAVAQWDAARVVDAGPLLASVVQTGTIGRSTLHAEWRIYADEPCVELRLRVLWIERHRLLKLTLDTPARIVTRWDGIPGGELERPPDGRERPLRDRTLVELDGGGRLGIACPEVFALDADEHRVRLTLLRSPLMGHHDPDPPEAPRPTYTDQGEHTFVLRFFAGPDATGARLDEHARMLQQPLAFADLTRGMPPQ